MAYTQSRKSVLDESQVYMHKPAEKGTQPSWYSCRSLEWQQNWLRGEEYTVGLESSRLEIEREWH